ncbi:MBL fold metallo-hydrolase [Polynucleobacter sp. 30F-ANTBAC]|jgi:hydroxyacylglutathione hydrolase|uniref:MBL fold metallo-hydrolase n=1 Tax=Polynucleobacter sp. 30F-ANTBAC TaxID=2689095 RepID=UPI001C0CC93E|nr:MBL fold metallo-hydrolase [Polynucleobacter sp. 30F-ANTBAC]MBU3599992.1 MBL fold metallo-hydrolase [Polynucleobacter sp. 30F-ANTBAC]
MTLKVILVPVTPFEQNCSILICQKTNQAAIVDPGGDLPKILEALETSGAKAEKILLTHGHVDHCAGAVELAQRLGVEIIGPHEDEKFWLDQLPLQSQRFGFGAAEAFTPQQWLNDNDTVSVGAVQLLVKHCPGHTPGHVIFYSADDRLAVVGDVLFAGSIGRTDFPRGNHADLIRSIREKLFPLGDDITFIPGHGPNSTFGEERQHNPYVGDGAN